ncbi:MAG TPA: hypothetical protein VG142_03055, partial [Trebonia sp.]|nr:hypothetical protein [Trebonia sp.]
DDPDDNYEAVDVGVYHGGDTLAAANAVVLSQLKHSTRHPDKAWTAARLAERRTRRGRDGNVISTRSVIADLAGTYAKLLRDGRSREELLGKVRISLVSNQPGGAELLAAVEAGAAWARTRPDGTGKAQLFKALAPSTRRFSGHLRRLSVINCFTAVSFATSWPSWTCRRRARSAGPRWHAAS